MKWKVTINLELYTEKKFLDFISITKIITAEAMIDAINIAVQHIHSNYVDCSPSLSKMVYVECAVDRR